MKLPTLTQLRREVVAAASLINERFGEPILNSLKKDLTPVTGIDYLINDRLKAWATERRLGYLGEEGNGIESASYYLYADPLDGTAAFLRGMATCTTVASIMKIHGDHGIPMMAVIHNPITGQTWAAERDCGIQYRRGRKIVNTHSIRTDGHFQSRVAICSFPGADKQFLEFEKTVIEQHHEDYIDQKMGAFALGGGLIASGLIDATMIPATSAVETAAMSLIVREVGGVCVDLHGKTLNAFEFGTHKGKRDFVIPQGAIIASRPKLAATLAELYKG